MNVHSIVDHNVFDVYYYPLSDGNFPQWVLQHAKRIFPFMIDPSLSDNLIVNDRIVYRNLSRLENLKDKTVLVIGGGPSTYSLTSETLDKFDYIFTMNHFFKNKLLQNSKMNLVSIGVEINLRDNELQSYIEKFDPIIAFELHPDWLPRQNEIRLLIDKENYFFYQTKFYGKIGVGARLIILALELGARDISFIGFDGPKAILRGQHAFEPGKRQLPAFYNEYNANAIHHDQYKKFWKYIKNNYTDEHIISLDKENEFYKWYNDDK